MSTDQDNERLEHLAQDSREIECGDFATVRARGQVVATGRDAAGERFYGIELEPTPGMPHASRVVWVRADEVEK